MSANELARKAGIRTATLSDILNRKNNPSLDSLERICKALGVTIQEFFAGDLEQIPPDIRRLINVSKELTPSERALLTQFLEQLTSRRRDAKQSSREESEVSEADIQVDRIAAHLEGEYGVHDPAMARFLRSVIADVIREYDEMKREEQE